MTLRNAFANLITETVSGAVEAAITRMDARQARQAIMEQPRDLQYARTTTDAMRVNIDNWSNVLYVRNDSTNGMNSQTVVPFGNSAIFMVDEREQQRIQTEQQFNMVRTQRWVIT